MVFAGSDLVICEGSSIVLNATGAVTYTWDGGVTNNLSFTPLSNATYTATGIDANGCEATDEVTVTLIPKPQPVISPNVISGTNPLTVEFSNQSLNALSYTWNFGNGAMVSTSDLSDVQYEFTTLGNHEVWLVATNGICLDSISTIITVYELGEPVIEVPNVFTPNGDDANETWSINTVNINEIAVIILNRWGGQIAEINDLHGAWDGKTSSGDDATDGTYYYKYLAKAINGKEFTGHGFITLVR
jgi:gliding motility-associated-like protein